MCVLISHSQHYRPSFLPGSCVLGILWRQSVGSGLLHLQSQHDFFGCLCNLALLPVWKPDKASSLCVWFLDSPVLLILPSTLSFQHRQSLCSCSTYLATPRWRHERKRSIGLDETHMRMWTGEPQCGWGATCACERRSSQCRLEPHVGVNSRSSQPRWRPTCRTQESPV